MRPVRSADDIAGFAGFPGGTFAFLRGLAADNSKAWFDAHRADYEAFYVAPALTFVAAIGPRLKAIAPAVNFEPRINGSLFRIQRDVRFSADKTPYKTHLDLWFWEGERRGWDAPGFFFRMFADRLILGAGMHRFEKPQLEAYRAAVVDARAGRVLAGVLDAIGAAGGYAIGGATRKTVPKGFDPGHARAHLLLHDGLYAMHEGAIPKEARGAAFVDFCAGHFGALAPLNRWLRELPSG